MPVAGLTTSKVSPETAPTILPLISIFGVRPRNVVACRSRGSSSSVSIPTPPLLLSPTLASAVDRQYRYIQVHISFHTISLSVDAQRKGPHGRHRKHPSASQGRFAARANADRKR